MYAMAMIILLIGAIFIAVAGVSASILHKKNKRSKV